MRLILFLCTAFLATPVLACGPDTDCVIGERTYRLYVPEGIGDAPVGALLFAHGYRGTAAGAMRNMSLRRLADDLGIALIALKSKEDDWSLAHRPREPGQQTAREYDYVEAVLSDAATRMALDEQKLAFTGFSAGGMMTWTMACGMSDRFSGFIPMSGTFWAPVAETCTTPPTNIVHIHGTEDATVPLQGRVIGPTRQGNVAEAMEMYAEYGGYEPTAEGVAAPGDMTCTEAENVVGKRLEICLFDGGHSFSVARLRHGYLRAMDGY